VIAPWGQSAPEFAPGNQPGDIFGIVLLSNLSKWTNDE